MAQLSGPMYMTIGTTPENPLAGRLSSQEKLYFAQS